MSTVQRFEDLLAWQRSRELVKRVYGAMRGCGDLGFRDQIQRAAVSVMSNIAEGFESGTRQEFINYLYISKASAGEVRAQLYAAYDIGYINSETFKSLKDSAEECSKLIATFISGVKKSPLAGLQYKKEKTKIQQDREEFDRYIKDMLEKGSSPLARKLGLEKSP